MTRGWALHCSISVNREGGQGAVNTVKHYIIVHNIIYITANDIVMRARMTQIQEKSEAFELAKSNKPSTPHSTVHRTLDRARRDKLNTSI